ncbi:hypothetical protein [Nocardia sp. NPDC056952]|uniref:hypothetical protein n=1 Tax=unclassified Nocardia TaxID=2637762 RepID=UPI003633CDCB
MATVAMGGEHPRWGVRRWRDPVAASTPDRRAIPPSGSRDEPQEREPEWENALAASMLAWTAFLGG